MILVAVVVWLGYNIGREEEVKAEDKREQQRELNRQLRMQQEFERKQREHEDEGTLAASSKAGNFVSRATTSSGGDR